jgi:hypothetical protein
VLVFEILLMIQRRLADIDGHHFRIRIVDRENRRLVRAAARNQDVQVALLFPIAP